MVITNTEKKNLTFFSLEIFRFLDPPATSKFSFMLVTHQNLVVGLEIGFTSIAELHPKW